MVQSIIQDVTRRIEERSRDSRASYLEKMEIAGRSGPARGHLSCGNLAHGFAACVDAEKDALASATTTNIGIVTAYNDMLSAHVPYKDYPDQIKAEARRLGAVAQIAGAVPAMCDGVTQGQPGMELSLFSRDVIAMATAIALSHNMFDGAMYLGICDKIVPGLLIGALAFGHVPGIFVPAGPMPSGLPNKEKAAVRQRYAVGDATKEELLAAESASYHSAGTCTFYGTANSNQMLMEIMGLQLPGSSFVGPNDPLRPALTRRAVQQVAGLAGGDSKGVPIGNIVSEKAIVNGVIGLLATGGSTNHTLHLIAIARAAGIQLNWDDMSDLSDAIPLISRVYPNGLADVNHFHDAGGMTYLISTLLEHGYLHDDVVTILGDGGLHSFGQKPELDGDEAVWTDGVSASGDDMVLRPADKPFQKDGGLRVLKGNLGTCVIKTSAVKPEHRVVKAPARVFDSQHDLVDAFEAGDLTSDMVAVVRFQGPAANGMPELHKLTPPLGVMQDRGLKVALVTDGRMSGASGKVPAAIHLTPETLHGGAIGLVRDGDMVEVDAAAGRLELLVAEDILAARRKEEPAKAPDTFGMGRELFAPMRAMVGKSDEGAPFVGAG